MRARAAVLAGGASALLVAGAPLLLWQAYRLWKLTPRLPAAPGETRGAVPGDGPPLNLLALGESTVAGVGASDQRTALGAATARALGASKGRAVEWEARGVNGATARSTRAELIARPPRRADLALVALGVNDVLRLTTLRRWQRDLTALLATLREACGGPRIVLAGVPPLDRFPRVRPPLNRFLGMRARALCLIAEALAADEGVAYLPLEIGDDPALFASDGFHPSDRGYELWGQHLAGYFARGITG